MAGTTRRSAPVSPPVCGSPVLRATRHRVARRIYFTAQAVSGGAQVAARYLRKISPDFPSAARPHLEATAQHYDRIGALLRPALTGEGGEKYGHFIGDLAKQKAHGQNVLRPVKAELAAVADDMEKALEGARPLPLPLPAARPL